MLTSAPFGLRPAEQINGGQIRVRIGTILTGYATAIYKGTPVIVAANGTLTIATDGSAAKIAGVFQGVRYVDSLGKPQFSPYWPASTAATDIEAAYIEDPDMEYEIQADGTVAQADVGTHADFTNIGTGTAATGLSSAALAIASISASTENQLQITGFGRQVGNAPADTFTIVRVRIASHQNKSATSVDAF